jgi:flavodoxin
MLTVLASWGLARPVHAAAKPGRTLVVYFSYSGTTKQVAEELHRQVGGDLVRIEPAKPYSQSYSAVSARAGKEYFGHLSPAVKTRVKNMDQYQNIFVGYPIWYNTAPMVVKTFLRQYDLRGKNIYPFSTFSSSRLGKSVRLIKKAAPGAEIKPGLPVDDTGAPHDEIQQWLHQVNFKQD